jgi:hypothetical protein
MLRKAYPNVYCYAFGTPGSIMDKQSCIESREYATTICCGNDMICRVGFRSLCKLRNDILDAICRAKKNKLQILYSMFSRNQDAKDLLYKRGEEPNSKFKEEVIKFKVSTVFFVLLVFHFRLSLGNS